MQTSADCSADPDVLYRSDSVLLGYLPLVYHLELRLLRRPIFLPWRVYLDAMEEHLLTSAEACLLQDPGHHGHGDQVQAQGPHFADLERYRHQHVP